MDDLAEIDTGTATAWFAGELATAACGAPPPDRGEPTMVERTAPEGAMAPLLRRDVSETYRVLAGEVVFFVGEDVVRARAGDVVVAPAGMPRTFRADSDGARWLVLTHVRSLERFAEFGRAVSMRHADRSTGWPCEAERAAVAAMGAANGIELLGPPGALPNRV
jgi:mannose-6-phosphate isomerase-like protein (cupin superfamily)